MGNLNTCWLNKVSYYTLLPYCTTFHCIVESSESPTKKRRRFTVPKLLSISQDSAWISRFNLDGKVTKTSDEIGDGGSSRV